MKDLPEIVGLAETQIRTEVAGGSFPQPISLNDAGRSIGWLVTEVDEWVRNRASKHRVVMKVWVPPEKTTNASKAKKKARA